MDRVSWDTRQIDPKEPTVAMIKNGARDVTLRVPGPAENHGQRAERSSLRAPRLEVIQGGQHP